MKNTIAILSLLAAFFVPAVSSKAAPQSQSNKATLAGTLTDPSGAPVGEVRITAQPEASSVGQAVSAISSTDGAYSLSLPAGRYRLRFSRASFAAREIVLTIASGESRVLNLHLDLELLSDSVIVTAQSVPTPVQQTTAPTDVISRETIDDRQAVSLPELLEFSPGIAVGRTGPFGGTASLFLNGGNSNFTKVLVDGTPINPPGSMVDFSSLTTENIDKIEIVRGAESAIYGSDAVSGVVQLFTHRGDTRVPAFTAYSEGGNFSSGRGGADLSGLVGKFDYSAAAAYFQTDGQGPNDYFVNRTLSGNFGYATTPATRAFPVPRCRARPIFSRAMARRFFPPTPVGNSLPARTGTTSSSARIPIPASAASRIRATLFHLTPCSASIARPSTRNQAMSRATLSPQPATSTKLKTPASILSFRATSAATIRPVISTSAILPFPASPWTLEGVSRQTPALARASFPA
jgi:outer membrane receptor protein involved in Fe transport